MSHYALAFFSSMFLDLNNAFQIMVLFASMFLDLNNMFQTVIFVSENTIDDDVYWLNCNSFVKKLIKFCTQTSILSSAKREYMCNGRNKNLATGRKSKSLKNLEGLSRNV